MPRIPPSGTGMLPPSTTQESSYADLVEPASLLVLDAPNLYRDIVQELEEGVGCLGQKAYFESDHWGADLSSVQARRRSSEPQVVTAQLVDGPAAHQLHVTFDFGSEIFKRPFNAGLTRGRQSIQIKSPSRTRLSAHGKGLQDVGAAGDAAVANHIYSVSDGVDDLSELIKTGSSTRQADARHD